MTINRQSAGPLRFNSSQDTLSCDAGCVALVRAGGLGSFHKESAAIMANGTLLQAAYNAFDGAARTLGIDAIDLAKTLNAGNLVQLIEQARPELLVKLRLSAAKQEMTAKQAIKDMSPAEAEEPKP